MLVCTTVPATTDRRESVVAAVVPSPAGGESRPWRA